MRPSPSSVPGGCLSPWAPGPSAPLHLFWGLVGRFSKVLEKVYSWASLLHEITMYFNFLLVSCLPPQKEPVTSRGQGPFVFLSFAVSPPLGH